MKTRSKWPLILALIFFTSPALLQAASENATATITVNENLQISRIQDLDFGVVYLGSEAQQIAPEESSAAAFQISGQTNTQYSIILPMDDSVVMTTDDGSDDFKKIPLNNFSSSPQQGPNGFLGGNGQQVLKVGATRSAITDNHHTGSYSATFTVEVVY